MSATHGRARARARVHAICMCVPCHKYILYCIVLYSELLRDARARARATRAQFLALNFLADGELTSSIIEMLVTKAQEEPHFNALFARLCAVIAYAYEGAVAEGLAAAGASAADVAATPATAAAVVAATPVQSPTLPPLAALAASANVPPLPPVGAGEPPRKSFRARIALACQAEFEKEVRARACDVAWAGRFGAARRWWVCVGARALRVPVFAGLWAARVSRGVRMV
jgi:hypothetical protein